MRTRFPSSRNAVALTMAASLALFPLLDVARAQAPAAPAGAVKPAPRPATAAPAATQRPADGGWPRAFTAPSGATVVLYQPQVASWVDQKHIIAYSAVGYGKKGAEKPALGSVKLESDTNVALDDRLVYFRQLKLSEVNFDKLDRDGMKEVTTEIEKAIPEGQRVIGLDRILASIDKSQIIPKNVEGVKADPPKVFYSTTPAVLVNIDGDPIWSPIKDNDLKYAINTNWDLFQHAPTNTLYLRNEKVWLTATKVEGPWTPAGTLPESFKKLPADDNWKEVKSSLPGQKPTGKTPTVNVSTTAAELILLTGAPNYLLVDGTTDLLWVQNTVSDVFRVGKTGLVYYLVSGRWFSAPDFTGPWTFATTKLPPQFAKIPLEHPRSRVLASVPGTRQAAEAVLLAQVPQTARVNKKEVKPPDVKYNGQPQFDKIQDTSLQRAVNTDKDIIKVGDLYYMCFQGVWFMSKTAEGPWEVASTVPKEIYAIPASSPAHNVTYVTVVEEDSSDDWVTFAAVAGYTGMMVAWGCAVWGSGWYYPPYIGYGGYYPVYYPYYRTYGAAAWYNPWTGTYGRSAVAYGPYGGVGATARYNPYTGTYARGAAAYGPYGARGAATAYNPRTGAYGATRQGSNVYGNWGSSYVQRGDDWARTGHVTNRRTGTTTSGIRTDEGAAVRRSGPGGSGFVAGGEDNVYAGRDGNVYKRNESGDWQKYGNGGWNDVNRPDQATTSQLNKDRAARTDGATRTRDYGNYQSSGGRSSGSYRSGGGARGGGMRGGGRRR
jgi:hypothetical protein